MCFASFSSLFFIFLILTGPDVVEAFPARQVDMTSRFLLLVSPPLISELQFLVSLTMFRTSPTMWNICRSWWTSWWPRDVTLLVHLAQDLVAADVIAIPETGNTIYGGDVETQSRW